MEIRVVENTDKASYITLPAMTEPGELTEDELTKVAGGNPVLVGIAIGAIGTSFGTIEAMTGKVSANVLDWAKQYGKSKQKPPTRHPPHEIEGSVGGGSGPAR
jgi:hypothetical protein